MLRWPLAAAACKGVHLIKKKKSFLLVSVFWSNCRGKIWPNFWGIFMAKLIFYPSISGLFTSAPLTRSSLTTTWLSSSTAWDKRQWQKRKHNSWEEIGRCHNSVITAEHLHKIMGTACGKNCVCPDPCFLNTQRHPEAWHSGSGMGTNRHGSMPELYVAYTHARAELCRHGRYVAKSRRHPWLSSFYLVCVC